MGIVKEAYHTGKANRYMRVAEVLTAGGALLASMTGRSRKRAVLAGAALFAGSALTRFGIFEAGIASAQDPKFTVVPQRERVEGRAGER